jgi:hypothetical protein
MMPLLDHFHAPLFPRRHWESFHVNWAGAIADDLNERLLPEGYFAEEHAHIGARVEIDVATFAESAAPPRDGATTTLPARVWTPPAPALVLPGAFPDSFEVLVFQSEGGASLVAAVELVSPPNKDRDSHRRALAVKCASYLTRGVSLVLIDIVTSRQANLHEEMMGLLGHGPGRGLPAETSLYAVAYRPLVRAGAEQVEVWPQALAVGQALPTLPLALNAEVCLPLDLEATYTTACQRRRLT